MPKPSRALAASFMISRSESDPITMETSGVFITSFRNFQTSTLSSRAGCLEGSRSNISSILHSFKTDQIHSLVGFGNSVCQCRSTRGHAQHPASAGVDTIVAFAGSGVKQLYVFQ